MQCPKCQRITTVRVYATKHVGDMTERYRECGGCGHAWRTYEEVSTVPVKKRRPKLPVDGQNELELD